MANNGLTLWILGGAGVTLLYAAYKGKSPLAVVTNHVAGAAAPSSAAPATSLADSAGTATGADSSGRATGAESAGGAGSTGYSSVSGAAYTVAQAPDGGTYVYDASGNAVSTLPTTYADHPANYIPPASTLGY